MNRDMINRRNRNNMSYRRNRSNRSDRSNRNNRSNRDNRSNRRKSGGIGKVGRFNMSILQVNADGPVRHERRRQGDAASLGSMGVCSGRAN